MVKYSVLTWLILAFTIAGSPALAQQNKVKGAYGGSKGIFVYLKEVKPFYSDNVAYCTIERKVSGEDKWEEAGISRKPANESDFIKKLKASLAKMPYDLSFLEERGKDIWSRYEDAGSFDSLKVWFGMLPVQEAMGVVFHDVNVQPGHRYEYRVQQFNVEGNIIQTVYYLPADFPGEKAQWEIPYKGYSALSKQVTILWSAQGQKLPPYVIVYRQEKNGGEWTQISPAVFSIIKNDSVYVEITDTQVMPKAVYRYKIIPSDLFGNPGTATESDIIGAYNFSMQAPVVEDIKAGNPADNNGINLSWFISGNDLVNSVRILRSTDYDNDYEQIAELPPTVLNYVDQFVEPNKKYYYKIILTGPLGELSTPSARVFGVSDDISKPLPPMIVSATGTENGIMLTVKVTEESLSGVRIFRKSDKEKVMTAITDLLPLTDKTVMWEDTANISGIRFYGYTANSENLSHIQGDFSDTVYARSLKKFNTPAVMGLNIVRSESVNQLFWLNMKFQEVPVAGYYVHRRELPSGEMKQLNDEIISAESNSYTDATVEKGKSYEYTVSMLDAFGNTGPQCDPVTVNATLLPVRPPQSVIAVADKSSVRISWNEVKSLTLKEYRVYRYTRGTKPVLVKTAEAGSVTEFTDKSVAGKTLYFYYITSVDDDRRESNKSTEVSIRTE